MTSLKNILEFNIINDGIIQKFKIILFNSLYFFKIFQSKIYMKMCSFTKFHRLTKFEKGSNLHNTKSPRLVFFINIFNKSDNIRSQLKYKFLYKCSKKRIHSLK